MKKFIFIILAFGMSAGPWAWAAGEKSGGAIAGQESQCELFRTTEKNVGNSTGTRSETPAPGTAGTAEVTQK